MDNNQEALGRELEKKMLELTSNSLLAVRRRKLESEVANIKRQLDKHDIIKEGNVKKLSPSLLGGFQERYLTLYPTKLEYKDNKESLDIEGKILLNEIALVEVLPKSGYFNDKVRGYFNIVARDRGKVSTYEFRVENKVEANLWVAAINAQTKIQTGNTTLDDSASAEAARAFKQQQQRRRAVETTNTRGWSNVQQTGNDTALLQREVAEKKAAAYKLLTPQEKIQYDFQRASNAHPNPYAADPDAIGARRKTRRHSKTLRNRTLRKQRKQRKTRKTRRHR